MTNPSAYVQLTLGRTRLLFPESELLSLEDGPEFGSAENHGGSVGTIRHGDAVLPLYNFDEQLQLLIAAPEDRRDCACLGGAGMAIGMLCDKAEIVEDAGLRIVPLPACMKSADSPVQALALQGSRILCVCNLAGMAGLIQALTAGVQP